MNQDETARRIEEIRRTEPSRFNKLYPNGYPEPEQAPETTEDQTEEVTTKPTPPRRRRKGASQ